MTAKKKIQLTKRSSREIALRKGFELPAREGKGVIGFEDMGDLRFKYFHLEGRLTRWPFFARMLLLTGAQLVFTLILYTRFVEALWIGRQDLGILFFCIFIVLSIPVIRAQVFGCTAVSRSEFARCRGRIAFIGISVPIYIGCRQMDDSFYCSCRLCSPRLSFIVYDKR